MNTFEAIYRKRLTRRFAGVKHFLLDKEYRLVFSTENICYFGKDEAGVSISDFICENPEEMRKSGGNEFKIHFKAEPEREYRLVVCAAGRKPLARYSCFIFENEAELNEISRLRTKLLLYGSTDEMLIPTIELFEGQIVYANDSFTKLCGYPSLVVHSMRLSNLVANRSKAAARQIESGEADGGTALELAFSRQDGSVSRASATVSGFSDENRNTIVGFVDITEKKRLEQANSMYTRLLSGLDDGVLICDKLENVFWCNDAFKKITGHDKNGYNALVSDTLKKYPELHSSVVSQLRNSTFRRSDTSFALVTKDGSEKYVNMLVFPLTENMYTIIIKDASAHNEIEKAIQSLKITDSFTGLWSPEYFTEQYEKTFAECKQHGTQLALMMIEISNFKSILQNNGPKTANNVLKVFALRAADENGGYERICRIGEARFALYYVNRSHDDLIDGINSIMNKMDLPFVCNEHDIFVKTSIGAGIYPYNSITSDELFNFTRAALEAAKNDKRSAYAAKSDSMRLEVVSHKHSLELELLSALENDEFTAYFQPRGTISDNSLIGGEALMRWESPVYGTVSPPYFIDLAKETDMLILLGYKIIELVCKNINFWNSRMRKPVLITVNLTHEQLVAVGFIETLQALLATYDVEPSLMEFEVSETDEQSNSEREAEIIAQLKGIGLSVSVDNFGTGVSSVANFDVNTNKRLTIERSIVSGLEYDTTSRLKAKQIISIAKEMGLSTLAKGVENEKQLELLREYGCDRYQGYFLSKPVPATEFGALLEADNN